MLISLDSRAKKTNSQYPGLRSNIHDKKRGSRHRQCQATNNYEYTFLFIKKLNSSSSIESSILGTSFIQVDSVATKRE